MACQDASAVTLLQQLTGTAELKYLVELGYWHYRTHACAHNDTKHSYTNPAVLYAFVDAIHDNMNHEQLVMSNTNSRVQNTGLVDMKLLTQAY